MNYTKPPLSLQDQIQTLKNRGLIINNEEKALHYLSNISFYRLRAYTYPFQDNTDTNHPFIKKIQFEEIISLYVFDRKLRILVFDALEKIEVSLRCKIIHEFSMSYGSHWFQNEKMYRDKNRFQKHLVTLEEEIKRSTETFIDHYHSKYTYPQNPPAWMSLEVISIGLLSRIYSNLIKVGEKKKIARDMGINKVEILESWMHSFSGVRNICAHHCWLWNRRFTITPILPENPTFKFIHNKEIHPNKLYTQLACIKYLLNIISPNNKFSEKLKTLISDSSMIDPREMGFPTEWSNEDFWL